MTPARSIALLATLLWIRAKAPHTEQARGGSGVGPGREHEPHQPVSALMNPGLAQRGHGCLRAFSS